LFETLAPLDVLATRKTLKHITDDEIDTIREMTRTLGHFYKKKDLASYWIQNYDIHDKLWKSCGNRFLYQLLFELKEKAIFINIQMYKDRVFQLDESYKSHLDIMESLEKRDFKNTLKLLNSHWKEKWFFSKKKQME